MSPWDSHTIEGAKVLGICTQSNAHAYNVLVCIINFIVWYLNPCFTCFCSFWYMSLYFQKITSIMLMSWCPFHVLQTFPLHFQKNELQACVVSWRKVLCINMHTHCQQLELGVLAQHPKLLIHACMPTLSSFVLVNCSHASKLFVCIDDSF